MMLFGHILLYLLIMETKSSEDYLILVEPDPEPELPPKFYKVIDRNVDDIVNSFQDWRMVPNTSHLYLDEDFLDHFNCSLDSISNESSVIVESKDIRGQNIRVENSTQFSFLGDIEIQILGPAHFLTDGEVSYDCQVDNLELIYPPAELALQIRDKNDVSYSDIAVGEAFKPKLDDAPISAKCFLRNSISKKTFGLESDLIYTNAIGEI